MIYNDFDKAIEATSVCVVCGRHADYCGVYIPNSAGFPAPPEGTTRKVIYGICKRHMPMAQVIGDHVEAQFEREYQNNRIH